MIRKHKKRLLIAASLILIGGLATGYYFYNKGPVDVKSARGIEVEAAKLYQVFSTDSATAGKRYTGKIVTVSGTVKESTVNKSGEKVLLLSTSSDGGYINCTMEGELVKADPGQPITLKGIAAGIGQGDADLGIPGDVYLTRCYAETK